jgi:uncharacterized protein (UPF0276 family)
MPLTSEALAEVAHRVKLLQDQGRALVAVENISSPIRIRGGLEMTDFLSRLVEATDCFVCVDLDDLVLDSRRHGLDPAAWLRSIDGRRVTDVRLTESLARDLRSDPDLQPLLQTVRDLPDAALVLALAQPTAPAVIERGLEALDAIC